MLNVGSQRGHYREVACRPTNWNEAALLHRVNPEKDEARFYFVSIGPALFDPFTVIRMWGRIGGFQRMLITPCRTPLEARMLATRLIQRRLKRGYRAPMWLNV